MPVEHRAFVAVGDEEGCVERGGTHGMVDLAAALASDSARNAPLERNNGALYASLLNRIDQLLVDADVRVPVEDAFATLFQTGREEWIRYGARLGFALARTSGAAEDGWGSWITAAIAWLERVGCGAQVHVGDNYKQEIADLERDRRAHSAAADLEQGTATEKTIGDLVDRITAERIEEHRRRHHADTQAPAAEPTAPKTRPTVEERPRRAPAASRAATAPPMRHRALDTGHVAAAVPLLDQCAADDLELAGHRHPRAADPWFAQHATG